MHRIADRQGVAIEDFDLTYPITRYDLVDNWEKVAALRIALALLHFIEFMI